jgi:hypothetical protein
MQVHGVPMGWGNALPSGTYHTSAGAPTLGIGWDGRRVKPLPEGYLGIAIPGTVAIWYAIPRPSGWCTRWGGTSCQPSW